MQNTACSLYVAGSLWFLTSHVRSAGHIQLEYLSVGLHFRGSSLIYWEIQVPSSVLWWQVSGNPTHLGVPVNSWGLCCCPGAALAGIFSWDTHQVLCVGWWDRQGPGSGKKAQVSSACLVTCRVQPPASPLQPERAERFLLPSACSGLEPVSWGS